jgi:cell division protein FtsL
MNTSKLFERKNLQKIILIATIICAAGALENRHISRLLLGDMGAKIYNVVLIGLCVKLLLDCGTDEQQ